MNHISGSRIFPRDWTSASKHSLELSRENRIGHMNGLGEVTDIVSRCSDEEEAEILV